MGLTTGSYEAYCFDQAIWYLGTYISNELDKVGRKQDKKEASNQAARKRRLDKLLGIGGDQPGQFADPAMFFQ